MRITRPLNISLLALLVGLFVATHAQTADDAENAYHAASSLYIAGKIQEASVEAEEGLRLAPGDLKLGALAELLRKLKDQQRGNSGQDDEKKQDKKNPDDKSKNEKQDKDKNRDGKNGDKKKDNPEDKKNPDGGSSGRNEKDPEPRDDANKPKPESMSEADAKRLLNSFADDEKKEQAERRKVIRARTGTEQDW